MHVFLSFFIFAHVVSGRALLNHNYFCWHSSFWQLSFWNLEFPCVINPRRLFMVNKSDNDSSQICSLQIVQQSGWCLGPSRVEVGFIKVGLWVWKEAAALLFIFPLFFLVLLDHTKNTQTESDNHCSLHRSPLNSKKIKLKNGGFWKKKKEKERLERWGKPCCYTKKKKKIKYIKKVWLWVSTCWEPWCVFGRDN